MIPGFAVTAVRWLADGNWKWALPSIVAVVAVAYAGVQRINYLDCKADWAQSIADAEKAAREFTDADRRHAEHLVGEYAGEIAELQEKYDNAQIKLNRAAPVLACGNTPAARAFDDGVSALEREAGGGAAPSAGGAGAAVPRATGPPGRVR